MTKAIKTVSLQGVLVMGFSCSKGCFEVFNPFAEKKYCCKPARVQADLQQRYFAPDFLYIK
jgi:hypothetical protein